MTYTTTMNNEMKTIRYMMELKDMEKQYGNVSCFDAPEAYDRMEELSDQIAQGLHAITDTRRDWHGIKRYTEENVKKALAKVVDDIENDYWELDNMSVYLLTQDEFLDDYVLGGLDDTAKDVFISVYYWMSGDDRGRWMYDKEVQGEDGFYVADERCEFVITVHR